MKRSELPRFRNWLTNQGCEILEPTNEYELIRWKGSSTGVIYTSGKCSGPYAKTAIACWKGGKKWNGAPKSTGRKGSYRREKELLLDRDGCDCFYCGKPLEDDVTVEHLLSLSAGGKNTLGNMVLAHGDCNQEAHNLTLAAKVKMAIRKRLNNQQLPNNQLLGIENSTSVSNNSADG
ncbi:MAG: HNH endonuclease [Thiotrichales bacterium]